MKSEVKILFAEDLSTDVELAVRTMKKGGINFQYKIVEDEKEYIFELDTFLPDIIISDYKMPTFDGMQALQIAIKKYPLTPFILLTGSINEEVAVECMKAGAWDYVIKENINKLPFSIIETLELKKIRLEKIEIEKKLKQSEEKFRNFFYKDLAGNFISTPEGEIIECNPAFLKFLDFNSIEEIRSVSISSLYKTPSDRDILIKSLKKKKNIKNFELELVRKDGKNITVIENIIGEYDTKGELKYLKGFLLDITENKKAEKEIQKLNRTYAVLSEINETIVRVKNKQVLFDEVCRIVEEIGKFDLTWIGIRDKDINRTRAVSYAGTSKEYLDLLIIEDVKSKKIVNDLFSGKPFIENNLSTYSSTQKWLKNALEFGFKSCAFFPLKTFEKNIGTINFYSKETFFFDDKEIKLLIDLSKDISYALEFIENDKKRKIAEKEIITQNEEYKALNEELRQTNEELLTAKEKAEESDKLKSAFLANMSHEIRTPMNGILGFTELLKENNLLEDQKKQFIEIIDKSGHRLLDTINDLINISKIEVGQEKITLKDLNINTLLKDLKTFFENETNAKNLELNIYTPLIEKDAVIQTDETKINGILTNLIKNSIKFTEKGKIDVGYIIKNTEIEFFVKDTGKGISEDFQSKLFKRFVQEEQGYTRLFEGSGLGLSIAKAYTELLDGKIWLEKSKIDEGTEFRFTLPFISKTVVKKENLIQEKEKNEKTNINILIAEDDENSFKYLSVILDKICNKIQRAKNGDEAIEIIKNNSEIDLILMDIQMPRIDGYKATKKIKEINPNIPIIAQTAYILDKNSNKNTDLFDDFILKPINKEELIEKIFNLV